MSKTAACHHAASCAPLIYAHDIMTNCKRSRICIVLVPSSSTVPWNVFKTIPLHCFKVSSEKLLSSLETTGQEGVNVLRVEERRASTLYFLFLLFFLSFSSIQHVHMMQWLDYKTINMNPQLAISLSLSSKFIST